MSLAPKRPPTAVSEEQVPPELVTFTPDDPEDPRNWRMGKKVRVVGILCALSFCAVFGSSSYAPGEGQVQEMFNVGVDVASLGLTVYVLGFAFGPIVWGPLSEIHGRRLPHMLSWPLLIAVIAPSAWANNIAVIMIFRFLAGACSACALNNGGGFIADMFSHTPQRLQKAIGFYAFCPLSGPIIGSIVGFFVAAHLQHGLWVIRVHWFFVIALWPLVFFVPETHGPTILAQRAARLRREGKVNARAAHELHTMTRREFLQNHLGRPIMMLVIEPIAIGAAVWVSLAYSIIYFFFQAFPVVFIEQNHISFQLGGLPFIGSLVGMFVCLISMGPASEYARRVYIPGIDRPGGTPVDAPEAGLKVALLGCVVLPVSMFWFAWTSTGHVHWISPVIASAFFGYSMLVIFYTFIAYVSQVYRIYASSANASNTLARSVIASIFPVIANPIISNLGTDWGVSLFGFLSFALFPIPLIFIRYGPALRKRSHFARESDRIIAGMRQQVEHKDETDAELAADVEAGEIGEGKATTLGVTNEKSESVTLRGSGDDRDTKKATDGL